VADGQISVTSVVQNPDGTKTVKETTITQAQFQAMKDARTGRAPAAPAVGTAPGPDDVGTAAQAINEDPGCRPDSLWLIDGRGCSGAHMLCLQNPGSVSLSTFGWGGVNGPWSVMSYWPGSEHGVLSAYSAGPYGELTQDHFHEWWPCKDISSAASVEGGYSSAYLAN
jgi:hypothetical protein